MVERRAPENLPDSPGVYLFRGDKGKLLYVGKARSLKKRIATYFGGGGGEGLKTDALLRQYRDIETIVTLDDRHFRAVRPRHRQAFRLLP